MTPSSPQTRGFTLIEMAVALFVMALLLGSLMVPLTTQVEQRQVSDTQKSLTEIRDALVGFAVANGYLPCPDTDNDGEENVNTVTGICSTTAGVSPNVFATGNIPWSTLGVASNDPWNNRFRYLVLDNFSRRSPASTFSFTSTGALRVCETGACTATLSTTAAAIVLSHGRNGYGAVSALGGTPPNPTSTDELENTDGDRDIVSRIPTVVGTTAGEFDDIVIWLSKYTLFNRMVSAGKLP